MYSIGTGTTQYVMKPDSFSPLQIRRLRSDVEQLKVKVQQQQQEIQVSELIRCWLGSLKNSVATGILSIYIVNKLQE